MLAEIAAYRPVIAGAAMRHNTETRPLHERDTYGKAFLQIMNLWEVDEPSKRFVFSRRFAKIAADLMGVDVCAWGDEGLHPETFWLGLAAAAGWIWHAGWLRF